MARAASEGRLASRPESRVAAIACAIAAAAILALAIAAGPVLAHDGGTGMAISLSAERLPPGGPLEIIGQGFLDGEIVDVRLVGPEADVPLGSVRVEPGGGFAVVLTVPPAAAAGPHRVDARVASGIVQQADLTIDPAAPRPAITATPNELLAPPATGREEPLWIWAPLAVVLVAAIGFALFLRRRTPAARAAEIGVGSPNQG